jgi:hypothetical protein
MTQVRGWFVTLGVCAIAAAAAQAATPWTTELTQQALAGGFPSKLPPHLAMVMGLAPNGESVEVRQLVSRSEPQVRTFNVSVANHRDLVLFVVDEKAQSTVAYLLAPDGKLRKAVAYQWGAEPQELSAAEAHTGLAREVRFWSGKARTPTPDRAGN